MAVVGMVFSEMLSESIFSAVTQVWGFRGIHG